MRTASGEAPAAGPIAEYARACLTAARHDRDWYRAAVRQLEAAGQRIMCTREPDGEGGPWRITDWRTGQIVKVGHGTDAYDAAWDHDGWTDAERIGTWMEDFAERGGPHPDWPDGLPVPELPGDDNPPRLALGLPDSLTLLLGEAIDAWACAAGSGAGTLHGRAHEVARLTGWSEDRVLACTASWLTLTGDRHMPSRPSRCRDRPRRRPAEPSHGSLARPAAAPPDGSAPDTPAAQPQDPLR